MIKKYRTKPIEIEAVQFTRNNIEEIKRFTGGAAKDFYTERSPNGKCYCKIETLECEMMALELDFIIKGPRGEFYPCKPDVFHRKYEVAE